MKLSLTRTIESLACIYDRMEKDNLRIGAVGYIGGIPEQLGGYFAERFNSRLIHLPSLKFTKHRRMMGLMDDIHTQLPECFLETILKIYKQVYRHKKRILPQGFSLDDLSDIENSLPVLLVDDNAYTGKTFEFWKDNVKKETGRDSYTFSVTAIGDYKPDYYCFENHCSFEWRPIGI